MKSPHPLLLIIAGLIPAGILVLAATMYTSSQTVRPFDGIQFAVGKKGYETQKEETLPIPEYLPRAVSILAVGDIMLGRYVQTLMEENGGDYPFKKIGTLFDGHDVVLANLEGPIEDGPKTPNNSLIFRFQEYTAPLLARHGITHVSLANNHTLNQGEAGLANTQTKLQDNGIRWFGHPANENGRGPTTIHPSNKEERQSFGQQVEWIGVNAALRSVDRENVISNIEDATCCLGPSDVIVVSVHWGNEYQHTPSAVQQELAHEWIDAGADMIIGHHPHVIQTVELYNDHLIFYSLGNFIFDQYFSTDTQEMLAVNILLEEETLTAKLIPLTSNRTQPQIADEKTTQDILTKLASWSDASIRSTIQDAKFILQREP